MNETIGEKGGHNDLLRTKRIQEKKKKLEEEDDLEFKEIEKEVRRKQPIVLIKSLPIILVGSAFRALTNITSRKKETGEVSLPEDSPITLISEETLVVVSKKKEEKPIMVSLPKEEEKLPKKEVLPTSKKQEEKRFYKESDILPEELSEKSRETLQQLKNHKIIEEYERKLMDIRYDLRNLIFDSFVLEQEEKGQVSKERVEELLERLNQIIERLEKLKEKMKIEDIDKYDDNYIYVLVEDYIREFQDKKLVSEIKDSPLYVALSEKLEELDHKKDDLQDKLTTKKEQLDNADEKLTELKEKYYSMSKINDELYKFQQEQNRILEELREKVAQAVTVEEKVKVEAATMSRQSRRLLRMMAFPLFLRGNRSARILAAQTAAYLYFMKQIVQPQTVEKKVRVIQVKDYHRDIENSIDSLEDASHLLSRTSSQVQKMIEEVRHDFSEYFGVMPELDSLLRNLEKVKEELREKEYEIDKLEKEQRRILEKNDAKVLTRGEYPL